MRYIIMSITAGYDPFVKSLSIAGLAARIYRRLFLLPQQIVITPENGYEKFDKGSDVAIKLMEYLARTRNVHIIHAGNGREFKINNYKVDGYIAEEKKVIEFLGISFREWIITNTHTHLGCYYHSHDKCTDPDDQAPNGKLNYLNFKETLNRLTEIEAQGYQVETFWECEVTAQLKRDAEMREFFTDYNCHGRIDPREAFKGGRTQAFKNYHKADGDRSVISVFDICSQYPGNFFPPPPSIITVFCIYIDRNFHVEYPTKEPELIKCDPQRVEWTNESEIVHEGFFRS